VKPLKVYVASSWRNDFQPGVVEALRADGHEVYDFRGSGDGWGAAGGGPGGFGWSEIDPGWQDWDAPRYVAALDHPRAEEGFRRDMDALRASDACLMVLPCGPSASMEMGWACGAGRLVVVYVAGLREPDLMVKMADLVTDNLSRVRRRLADARPYPGGRYVCACECGGTVRGVEQLGRLFTWCDRCTPVVRVKVSAVETRRPEGGQTP
jgi:hypothetical protein